MAARLQGRDRPLEPDHEGVADGVNDGVRESRARQVSVASPGEGERNPEQDVHDDSSPICRGNGRPFETGRCQSPQSTETKTADIRPRLSPSWCTWASSAPLNETSSSRKVAGK